MRVLRGWFLCYVVCLILLSSLGRVTCDAQEGRSDEKLVLTSLYDVRNWVKRNGSESVDVDLEAQLVFAGPHRSWFAIQSSSNAIRVIGTREHSEKLAKLPLGTLLRVKGTTIAGKTDLRLESFEVLSLGKPLPSTPMWQNVFDQAVDEYALVETELLANEFYVGPYGTVILCNAGILAIRLEIESACDITEMQRMLHAKLRAKGSLSPIGVDVFSKYSIFCMRAEQVEVAKDYAMSNLRLKQARVLFSDHISTIVLADTKGPMVLNSALARNINPGDIYDIFYVMDDQQADFNDSQIVVKGFLHQGHSALDRAPQESMIDLENSIEIPIRVVRTGKVVSQNITRPCFEILLEDEHNQFRAIIPKWQMTNRNLELRVGDTIEVCGAPVVSTDANSQGLLNLYVAHKDDIALVRRLDEDSSRRLRISLIVSILILGAICTWAILLRFRIQSRTRQLAEITLQLKELFNTVQDGLVVCDKKGRILRVNSRYKELFGFSPKINSQIFGLTESSEAKLFSASLEQLVGTDSFSADAQREIALELKGQTKRVACHNSPIMDPKGRLIGVLWIFADVTEKRLIEEKMISAQRMEVVGQLAGGMAHDFNNILTVIKANLFMCRGYCQDTPQLMNGIDLAGKAVASAEQLTKNLLGLAKKSHLTWQVINVREFMTELYAMISASFNETLAFDLECDHETDVFIKVDVCRLQQVIINLCINARDALDKSEGRVTLKLGVECCDGIECALISVSDNGKGIPEDIRNRVFEPFFSTKSHQIGTGLGLSVALGLVEQMGGNLSFNSVIDKGTTFVVRFKCLCGIPAVDSGSDEFTLTKQTRDISEISVMIIDDDAQVIGSIASMISHSVKKVSAHNDTEAAIESIAAGNPWDVVLLDMYLQNASGCEVAEKIQQLVPGVKLLFMSGSIDSAAELMRAKGFGNYRLLQKPFDSNAVINALATV